DVELTATDPAAGEHLAHGELEEPGRTEQTGQQGVRRHVQIRTLAGPLLHDAIDVVAHSGKRIARQRRDVSTSDGLTSKDLGPYIRKDRPPQDRGAEPGGVRVV